MHTNLFCLIKKKPWNTCLKHFKMLTWGCEKVHIKWLMADKKQKQQKRKKQTNIKVSVLF